VRFVAALLCLGAVAGCTGSSNGALSVEDARDKDPSEVVTVEGPVVMQFGKAMICNRLAASSPPQCDAGLWLSGPTAQLRELEFESEGGVRWAESATLEGRVDGNGFFVLT
jgi:hypothetical protein